MRERFLKVCESCRYDVDPRCETCRGRRIVELVPATEVGTGATTYLEVIQR